MDTDRLAFSFVRFADSECRRQPLYDAICRIAAGHPAILDLMQGTAAEQRRPNLLLAAVHELVLAGTAHALAQYFPSVGGSRPVDAELAGHLVDFCRLNEVALRQRMSTRATQTNEIGRCTVLWPLLRHLSASTGRKKLALLDVGCSAGLNLGVDRYHYDYGELQLGAAPGPAVPQIVCTLLGKGRPSASGPEPSIVCRMGIDPAPINLFDDEAVRWLRACLWPNDSVRRERMDRAITLAREQRWPVQQHADCSAAAVSWAESLPADVLPVIFNSWVLTYFNAAALARHIALMQALVQRCGAAWISAEEARLRIGDEVVPALPDTADAEHRSGTLWALMLPGQQRPHTTVLARSHAHGHWLEWLGNN